MKTVRICLEYFSCELDFIELTGTWYGKNLTGIRTSTYSFFVALYLLLLIKGWWENKIPKSVIVAVRMKIFFGIFSIIILINNSYTDTKQLSKNETVYDIIYNSLLSLSLSLDKCFINVICCEVGNTHTLVDEVTSFTRLTVVNCSVWSWRRPSPTFSISTYIPCVLKN